MPDPMTPVRLERVEADAEKVGNGYPNGSPGPWQVMADNEGQPAVYSEAARDWIATGMTTLDAAFVASCDPPTVKAMAEALRLAEKALAEADGLVDAGMDPGDHIVAALAELRSRVDFTIGEQGDG